MAAKPLPPPSPPFPTPQLPVPAASAHPCKVFHYPVKVVCGPANPVHEIPQSIVAPGWYFTAINIHNPATCKTVTFRWRTVIAHRVGQPLGALSPEQTFTLRPQQAVEIDTPDILRATQSPFSKGFVVIESPCELDVVAVYTAAPLPAAGHALGSLVALHTERVPARMVEACQDSCGPVDLSTGVADWTLTSAVDLNGVPLAVSTPCAAAVIQNGHKSQAWGTQAGALWTSVNPFADVYPAPLVPGFVPGFYTFQTCFSLCSGFENARLDLHMLNDDQAQVWLNGTQIGGTYPVHFNGAPTPITITQGFLPGLNCLSVVVRNTKPDGDPHFNPMGLNLKAALQAARGHCPDCGCGCGDEKLVRPAHRTVLESENPSEANPATA